MGGLPGENIVVVKNWRIDLLWGKVIILDVHTAKRVECNDEKEKKQAAQTLRELHGLLDNDETNLKGK